MMNAGEPELITALSDATIGLHGWIVIDSTLLGPAFGGIRRARYRDDDDALADARRLARAMRDKCALAGLAAGGAKAVLVDRGEGHDWPAVYAALGREVESLGGRWVCGPDVGTGAEQLGWVRRTTLHCNPASNDASRSTADGVLAAMRAVWLALGARDARGRTVVVQGLGGVGGRVARGLVDAGATVIAADPDPDACARGRDHGVTIAAVDALASIPCDVLAPCALGHAIDLEAAARWPCRAICGAANNMLVPGADSILHARGVVVVPDVIASAGAVIEGVCTVLGHDDPITRTRIAERIAAIEHTTASVLAEAAARGLPSAVIASERARTRLDSPRLGLR
ncbi:MAG: amino acid dehydrogenase [Deltaproteobacteria bacterium]|nr:amino acid dehydrogenase [Nannocystaceae bacterium]